MNFSIFDPSAVLVTGVESDPDEPDMTRVYVGPRYDWKYVLVSGDEALKVRREFHGSTHLVTVLDPEAQIFQDVKAKDLRAAQAEASWQARMML